LIHHWCQYHLAQFHPFLDIPGFRFELLVKFLGGGFNVSAFGEFVAGDAGFCNCPEIATFFRLMSIPTAGYCHRGLVVEFVVGSGVGDT
jgi:hypothetical protein